MNARRDPAAVPPDRFAFRVFVFMESSTRLAAAGSVPLSRWLRAALRH
jgi:hypothetical protein